MKILVLNCGSSSIKYKLYNMDDNSVLAAGGVERIGLDEAFIKVTLPNGEKKKIMHDMPDHKEGVNFVFQCLLDSEIGAIKSLDEIDAVGHRIVQGGDLFEKSVIVDTSRRYASSTTPSTAQCQTTLTSTPFLMSCTRSITYVATASTEPATATYRSASANTSVATSRHSASSPATSATVPAFPPLSSASASTHLWV